MRSEFNLLNTQFGKVATESQRASHVMAFFFQWGFSNQKGNSSELFRANAECVGAVMVALLRKRSASIASVITAMVLCLE